MRPRFHRLLAGMIGLVAIISALTVAGPGVGAAHADPPTTAFPPPGYSPVFTDDFSEPSLDTSLWNYRQTSRSNDSNVSVSGGELHVNMQRVSTSTGLDGYRGGGISSKQRFGYGYYEIRAFVPAGIPGWHPAFWTQIWDGAQAVPSYNADFTELDVFETQPTTVAGVRTTYLDGGNYSWNSNGQGVDVQLTRAPRIKWQPKATDPNPVGSWHTFGLLYTAQTLTYSLDGVQVGAAQTNSSLPNSPMSLWLTAIPTNTTYLDSTQPVGHSYGTFDVDRVTYYAPDGVTPSTTPALSSLPADTGVVTQDFSAGAGEWTPYGSGWWTVASSGGVPTYRNSSSKGDAISTFGLPVNDLPYVPAWSNASVEGTVTLTAAGSGAGLLGRYQDAENYYYLQVNPTTQQVSLVKKTDPETGPSPVATVTTLATAPLTITTGTPYDLKLSIKDNTLTGYVNGSQVLSANDTTFMTGGVGVKGYKQSFGVSGVQITSLG